MSAHLSSPSRAWMPERLLRDHVRQDRPIARVLHRRAGRGDRARIVRVAVAATGLGGSEGLLRLLEQEGLDLDVVGGAVIRDVQLQRRAGQHADRGAVQLLRGGDVQRLLHHESLAGVEVDGDLVEVQLRIARESEGAVADQHVDLARLQHREAHLGRHADILDLVRVAEHGRGDGTAIGYVEAVPLACRVLEGEARDARVNAAEQLPALADRVQRRALDLRQRRPGGGKEGDTRNPEHPLQRRCRHVPHSFLLSDRPAAVQAARQALDRRRVPALPAARPEALAQGRGDRPGAIVAHDAAVEPRRRHDAARGRREEDLVGVRDLRGRDRPDFRRHAHLPAELVDGEARDALKGAAVRRDHRAVRDHEHVEAGPLRHEAVEVEEDGVVRAGVAGLELGAGEVAPVKILHARVDADLGDARRPGGDQVRAPGLHRLRHDPDERDREGDEVIAAVRGVARLAGPRRPPEAVHGDVGFAPAEKLGAPGQDAPDVLHRLRRGEPQGRHGGLEPPQVIVEPEETAVPDADDVVGHVGAAVAPIGHGDRGLADRHEAPFDVSRSVRPAVGGVRTWLRCTQVVHAATSIRGGSTRGRT